MFKSKNLKKIISLALVTAMLVCSLFTMSVTAVESVEADEVSEATILEEFGYNVEFSSWSNTSILPDEFSFEPLDREMTKEENIKLFEALEYMQEIDYDDYETISGDYFEIKQIPLLNGYCLNLISIDSSATASKALSIAASSGPVYKSHKVSVTENGKEIASAELYATFITTPASVSVQSQGVYPWVASGIPLTWSISPISTHGTSTLKQLKATATATGTNPNGSQTVVPYYLEIRCAAGE